MFRRFDYLQKLFLLLFPLIVFVSILLIYRYDTILEQTRQEMQSRAIMQNKAVFDNVISEIEALAGKETVERLRRDPLLRQRAEQLLRVASAPDVQNLFIVFKDPHGAYRFLIDAEVDPDRKALFREPFLPVSSIWDDVYRTETFQSVRHQKMEDLWVSVGIPLLSDGEVGAVLGADISYRIEATVSENLRSFQTLFSSVALFFTILMLLVAMLMFFYERRRSRSFKDPLTGTFNRAYLYEVIASQGIGSYALVLCDIDHFKKINDTYGHDTGDIVLKIVVKRIMKHIRKEDSFIRYGGEEFLLLYKKTGTDGSGDFVQRLLHAISSEPFAFEGRTISVTMSIGLYADPSADEPLETVIKKADLALYRAKNSGRNRCEIYQRA